MLSHPIATDTRRPVSLLRDDDHYFIAATVGPQQDDFRSQALGDLLVRYGSAVGNHLNKKRNYAALLLNLFSSIKLPVDE